LRTAEGKAARQFAEGWLNTHALIPGIHVTESGWDVLVRTHKDRREKYGRYLADVFALTGDQSLNLDLLSAGHAVPYDGGKR
jgi:endonuclease YncB( thermonuclease family)